MKKITPDESLSHSAEIVTDNVEQLRALFPEAFTEGKIDFDVLRQVLGDAVDEREEKYGLNWHGKRKARQLALTPSTGTLRPCPEESVDWDTTQNLMIEGDNLEVLKLLQKSYAGKVKLIYIDPPYNTGKDFVYPDNFQDNIRNYLEITGQVSDGGNRITSNTETSGRFHTDWLNMMYPRLKLARNLLQENGVIFISIDDGEVASLRQVLDDVFGPENFICTVIWQKVYAPKSSARHFSEDHDYVVVYAKASDLWSPGLLPRTEEQNADYTNPDNDPRGPWKANNLSARNFYSKGTYSITCPGGRIIEGPPKGRYWSIAEEKLWKLHEEGRVWWGKDGNNVPAPKIYFSEVKQGRVPQTLWTYQDVGHTQEAKKVLVELMNFESSAEVFETPKPPRLIDRMLELATSSDSCDLVLDFFAGSGTTGHTVFLRNAGDGGNRRFILVQLPEPTEHDRFPTIAEMTKERLRLAAAKSRDTSPLFSGDLGFRVFKLDASNIQTWDPDRENLKQSLLDSIDHIKPNRSESDVLYELLLKLGLDLCVPIEQRKIAGKTVHSIGAGVLLMCLAEEISRDDVESLAHGMIAWHKELAPSGETTIVFRDSGFQHKKKSDDVAKTNITEILKQHGLKNVRSL
jgi:adenine-specific DNA-methyltransferase